MFTSIEAAQAGLDGWVETYNYRRPNQAIGKVPPFERFWLAEVKPGPVENSAADTTIDPAPVTTRRVLEAGTISFATAKYKAGGRWLAGQSVEVVCDGGLVQIFHRGVLMATHARRHPVDKQTKGMARNRQLRPSRPTATAASVTRKVDSSGNVCFAGTSYRPGPSTAAARSRWPWWATRWRSPSATSSSAPTKSATTAPESTAPWPTPAADPIASTPPKGLTCRAGTGVKLSGGYRVLTLSSVSVATGYERVPQGVLFGPETYGSRRRRSAARQASLGRTTNLGAGCDKPGLVYRSNSAGEGSHQGFDGDTGPQAQGY